MENTKKIKPLPYYLTKLLSNNLRTRLIKFLVNRKCGDHIIDLPDDLSSVKNILFILPENLLDAIYQVQNIISIIGYFSKKHNVHTTILCEEKIAPYFNNLQGINTIMEYELSQRYLFSSQLLTLHKRISKEYIDLCVFLERYPDLSLLYLVGQIHAKVRVTYSEAGEFPFFNLRIQSVSRQIHKAEQNNLIARTLGAKLQKDLQLGVSRDKIDEIEIMLTDFSIATDAWLGGIDAQLFYFTFGREWTEDLITKLNLINNTVWYLYARSIPEHSFLAWLKAREMPVFYDISPSRLAALLHKTKLVLSGKTMLFELANLLNRPAIGLFQEQELNQFCRETSQSIGIPYTKRPDEQTILDVCQNIRKFSTPVF